MIRYFKVYIFLFLCIFFAILLKIKEKKDSNTTKSSPIPKFMFYKIGNSLFTKDSIMSVRYRLIINHFSPNCEHCQYMASEFLKDSQKLKDIQILMITSADSSSAAKFNSDYKLSLLSNITILRDTNYQFQKIFGTGVVPSFFIYEQNKLVKKVIGETIIDNLIN